MEPTETASPCSGASGHFVSLRHKKVAKSVGQCTYGVTTCDQTLLKKSIESGCLLRLPFCIADESGFSKIFAKKDYECKHIL